MNKLFKKIFILFIILCLVMQAGCLSLNISIKNREQEDINDVEKFKIYANDEIVSYTEDKTCFCRNNILNDEEKILYDAIYNELNNHKTNIKLDMINGYFDSQEVLKKELANAVYSIIRDHPHLFMYNGAYTYEYSSDLLASSVNIEFKTTMDFDKAYIMQQEIDKITENLRDKTKNMDDYHKSKYIYTYIAQNTIYNESNNAHNMYGCLVEGVAVCEGYAKAYSYIMQQFGIPVAYISGVGKDELHAWNLVNINNNWYHVDCTWGDPKISLDDSEKEKLYVDYSYLHLTTEMILTNHVIDDFYKNIPICESLEANYHYAEALYLAKFNESEFRQILSSYISNVNYKNKDINISIRYALANDVKKADEWMESEKVKGLVKNVNFKSYSYSWTSCENGAIDIQFKFEI